jgi:hypothetical protein
MGVGEGGLEICVGRVCICECIYVSVSVIARQGRARQGKAGQGKERHIRTR